MNDKIISTFEDESEVLMYQGHRVKFNFSRSVWARLIQASDVTKANYKEIREYISSFEHVKIRESWNQITVVQSKRTLVKMNLTKNDVYLCLALTPAQIAKLNYEYEDVSKVKAFEATPVKFRINENPESLKKAIKLVNVVMSRFKVAKTEKVADVELPEYQSHDELINNGKIKVYVRDLDENKIYSDQESLNIYKYFMSEAERTRMDNERLAAEEAERQRIAEEERLAAEEAERQRIAEEERLAAEEAERLATEAEAEETPAEETETTEAQPEENIPVEEPAETEEAIETAETEETEETESAEPAEEEEESYDEEEEDEEALRMQDTADEEEEEEEEEFDGEEDEEKYLKVSERDDRSATRKEIEDKVNEYVNSGSNLYEGFDNEYKFINAIVSSNIDIVMNRLDELEELIKNIKVEYVAPVQPTYYTTNTEYIEDRQPVINEPVEEETAEEPVEEEPVEEAPAEETPAEETVEETPVEETAETEMAEPTETYPETTEEYSAETEAYTEEPQQYAEEYAPQQEEPVEEAPVEKAPAKKQNFIAKMNETELPKSSFYLTFGIIAFVFIVTMILLNIL